VTLDSTGSWNKQKTLAKMKGYQVLRATDKCIVLAPNIKVQMLENIYEMVCKSKIMYGIEIWGLDGAWKEVDKVHSVFCKKKNDRYTKLRSKWICRNGTWQGEWEKQVSRTDCKMLVSCYVFRDGRTDKTMLQMAKM
jgi:hypothetical protein